VTAQPPRGECQRHEANRERQPQSERRRQAPNGIGDEHADDRDAAQGIEPVDALDRRRRPHCGSGRARGKDGGCNRHGGHRIGGHRHLGTGGPDRHCRPTTAARRPKIGYWAQPDRAMAA
jgi:hypothetical protein